MIEGKDVEAKKPVSCAECGGHISKGIKVREISSAKGKKYFHADLDMCNAFRKYQKRLKEEKN